MKKLKSSDYKTYSKFIESLAKKLTKAPPTQYYVQRFIDNTTISFYPTPDATAAANHITMYYIKRIQDVGGYSNNADVPYRFVPCMTSGLAYYLSQKVNPQVTQQLKMLYEDELNRALVEDGSSTSTFITPKAYYPDV